MMNRLFLFGLCALVLIGCAPQTRKGDTLKEKMNKPSASGSIGG
jgi:hypothetical protein